MSAVMPHSSTHSALAQCVPSHYAIIAPTVGKIKKKIDFRNMAFRAIFSL
ncbi:hypothetical protein Syun_029775 [Stephania yunnanensis]|uniref:Uncharacterized protein n=1 Tax=Stephania yunnanensis TaxID=152371 RepID=A0AAP0E688_9MAGN